jgi:hypothetical protein
MGMRSGARHNLRQERQKTAKQSLTAEQVRKHPVAAEQFSIFSGKKGYRTNARPFESFVEQHG